MKFSQRAGINKVPAISMDEMSKDLINDIWNVVYRYYTTKVHYNGEHRSINELFKCNNSFFYISLWEDFFYLPIDTISRRSLYEVQDAVKSKYYSFKWYEICDFLEFISGYIKDEKNFFSDLNEKFKRHNYGYRIINKVIVPITNELELTEIEAASRTVYEDVNEHINKALDLISNKINPDYENSIKESITAVESICIIITGNKCALGESLKLLEKKNVLIHPALKSAFEKLYGYTSDEKGIRHAGSLDSKDSTLEEAKFMVVACSAFVNYLIEILSQINN